MAPSRRALARHALNKKMSEQVLGAADEAIIPG